MEVILIIVGIINIILLVKLWGTCNVINAIGDVIIFERENLKGKFIDDVEKLHEKLFNQKNYSPTNRVRKINDQIITMTNSR